MFTFDNRDDDRLDRPKFARRSSFGEQRTFDRTDPHVDLVEPMRWTKLAAIRRID